MEDNRPLMRLGLVKKRSADVWVNGELFLGCEHVLIRIPRNGVVLEYGQHLGGPDGFRYVSPGGVIIAAYAFIDGSLHILVIDQLRYLMRGEESDGVVLATPRGFYDGSVPALRQAQIEFAEEVGEILDPTKIGDMVALPGSPVNIDNGFTDTVTAAGRGHHYFAIEVPENSLEREEGVWRIREDVVAPNRSELAHERIHGHRFLPFTALLESGDALNIVAAARLRLHLDRLGLL